MDTTPLLSIMDPNEVTYCTVSGNNYAISTATSATEGSRADKEVANSEKNGVKDSQQASDSRQAATSAAVKDRVDGSKEANVSKNGKEKGKEKAKSKSSKGAEGRKDSKESQQSKEKTVQDDSSPPPGPSSPILSPARSDFSWLRSSSPIPPLDSADDSMASPAACAALEVQDQAICGSMFTDDHAKRSESLAGLSKFDKSAAST